MKICIVTVYNSINSGSYWQARILGYVIERIGHQVYYLERNDGSFSKKYQLKYFLKTVRRFGLVHAFNYLKSIKEFRTSLGSLKILPNKKENYNCIDCFVLGSDTIWNLNSKYFSRNYKKYWGELFREQRVITYAASVANTPLQAILEVPELQKNVEKWDSISVRDKHTFEVISSMATKPVELVCDPTLLLSKKEYEPIIQNLLEDSYIFLYLFSDISNSQVNELVQFARKENLRIISGTSRWKYCDKTIVNSPQSFLSHMFHATYIITDTFHGTVFSVNFEKKFVAINRNKNKVNEFLYSLNFNNRLIEPDNELVSILTIDIDYKQERKKLDEYRKKSLCFLENAVNRVT